MNDHITWACEWVGWRHDRYGLLSQDAITSPPSINDLAEAVRVKLLDSHLESWDYRDAMDWCDELGKRWMDGPLAFIKAVREVVSEDDSVSRPSGS